MSTREDKARFNIIDVVIVFVVIGVIVASFVRGDIVNRFTESDDKVVVYTFEAKNLKVSSALYISNGDMVYIKDSGKYIGTITGYIVRNAQTIIETTDGKLIEGTLPDRIDLIITVETKCLQTDAGIFINDGLFISAGKEFDVATKKITFPMVVEDVYLSDKVVLS